jgi:quinol monooxygenase YgiN
MEALLADMVEAAVSEPGVEIYSFHRGDENTFWFFALLTDRDSMRQHRQTDAVKAFMAEFANLAASPPHVSVTVPVAAIGLDLDLDDAMDRADGGTRPGPGGGIDLTSGP